MEYPKCGCKLCRGAEGRDGSCRALKAKREEFLLDTLTTAIEAGHTYGIGYWAHVRDLTRDPKLDDRITYFEVCEHADSLDEVHIPESEWKKINTETLKEAFKRCEQPIVGLHDATRAALVGAFYTQDAGDVMDGPMADIIIQIAAFGEVKFS